MFNVSPAESDHSQDVASKGDHHDTADSGQGSTGDIQGIHDKSCALAKLAEAGDLDKELSEDWVKEKLAVANENLTAIHDYIVNDKQAADSKRHGDGGGDGGDMGGGFIISIERALGK